MHKLSCPGLFLTFNAWLLPLPGLHVPSPGRAPASSPLPSQWWSGASRPGESKCPFPSNHSSHLEPSVTQLLARRTSDRPGLSKGHPQSGGALPSPSSPQTEDRGLRVAAQGPNKPLIIQPPTPCKPFLEAISVLSLSRQFFGTFYHFLNVGAPSLHPKPPFHAPSCAPQPSDWGSGRIPPAPPACLAALTRSSWGALPGQRPAGPGGGCGDGEDRGEGSLLRG